MKLPLQKVAQGVVPVLVLIGSVLIARALIASRPEPEKKPVEQLATLVEVQVAKPARAAVRVEAQGTVTAVRAIALASEVAGRITWRHPQLTTGGLIAEGELLLKIDPSDYKLALAQEEANAARARTDLELEMGRRAVAEREWQMFGAQGQAAQGGQAPAGQHTQSQTSLALRDPQLRSAKLSVESAESGLEKAKLLLGRTGVRAPFNAVVRTNDVETGRLVTPGQTLAELVATDTFVVAVSLPVGDLAWLRVPGMNAPPLDDAIIQKTWASPDPLAAFAALGTPAIVRQQAGDGHIVRNGLVTRLLGDLDPVGRMARVLVAIDDPLGRKQPRVEGVQALPILLGAYVAVELEGRALEGVVELPRLALRDGSNIYLVDAQSRLAIRSVEVLRRQADHVLIGKGLGAGDRVIISPMPTAIQGMLLKEAPAAAAVPPPEGPVIGTPP